jgi:hypothetical protein
VTASRIIADLRRDLVWNHDTHRYDQRPGPVAAILSNEARGFTPPGRLDWTDARGRLHRVRCVRNGNSWALLGPCRTGTPPGAPGLIVSVLAWHEGCKEE